MDNRGPKVPGSTIDITGRQCVKFDLLSVSMLDTDSFASSEICIVIYWLKYIHDNLKWMDMNLARLKYCIGHSLMKYEV